MKGVRGLEKQDFLCDLTQSYSAVGGGIRTYLTAKRKFIDRSTYYRHLLIVPGKKDHIFENGRHVTVEIGSPPVPGSPNYRLLLRSKAVIKTLQKYHPKTIECLDAYNLPWAAIKYRALAGNVKLIAGYRTDFPTVYVKGISRKVLGRRLGENLRARAYKYAGKLYANFDAVYALEPAMAKRLQSLGVNDVDVLPLGVDTQTFHPNKRCSAWRADIGAAASDPVLVYVGRIDREKQAEIVVEAFQKLPPELNAVLVMLGEGNLKAPLFETTKGQNVIFPGFISDRHELAKILASSDIYVSAMAHETFGISIIEAQAAALPVIGVAAGAMPERVPGHLGLLGPVGDAGAMAENIIQLWKSGKANDIGRKARQHVEDNFSWDRTFAHLFNHIYAKASGGSFSV